MDTTHAGDHLHRLVKLALDTGEAATVAEAERVFAGYRLVVATGPDVAASATLQAAVLTAVNTGRRCFLGGVQVVGDPDIAVRVPWRGCRTLGAAVADLQGTMVAVAPPAIPRIVIGDAPTGADPGAFAVRATFDGWCGGVVPVEDGRRLGEQHDCPPAGVLAGALAVSEAFQFVRGGNAHTGRRAVGLSLWRPDQGDGWLEGRDPGPALEWLPSRLWLIGLGHLGQAYLWTLGLLPYAAPDEVQLVLQDFDRLVPANDSTSLLTTPALVGAMKTRAMARWCEERGFRAVVQERRFADNFTVAADEPQVAVCGVDNRPARAVLEDVGFRQVIEAGLGRGPREYLAFQVHTFPAPAQRSARARWGGGTEASDAPLDLIQQPAYQALLADGLDQCGLTLLAGRTVGAPFVGAVTATLVVAELLRLAIGAHRYALIDGTLRSPQHRQAVMSQAASEPFNPGVTRAVGIAR